MDIPVVILCGGQGTRMGSTLTKKELIDIGGRPLLWHVLRIFSAYNHNTFLLALGHLGDQVRRYFLEYEKMAHDTTLYIARQPEAQEQPRLTFHNPPNHAPWQVTLVDTGLQTERAHRIAHLAQYLPHDRFFAAYGEAVADIQLDKLLAFHQQHGKLATITGVQVHFQYGVIEANKEGTVSGFIEKPPLPYWINGGFMLFERAVLDLMRDTPNGDLERELLPQLAQAGELKLFQHDGYWQSMKTLKDAHVLKKAWQENQPWKVW